MVISQTTDGLGEYSRVKNVCDPNYVMLNEIEVGYWIYYGTENSIKTSETTDFTNAEVFGLEYTDDYSYFSVTAPAQTTNFGDIMITEVYKKVK